MAETETIGLDAATDLIRRALVASGVAETGARLTAEALVAAEAEGQVGHGFSRLADYAAQRLAGCNWLQVQGRAPGNFALMIGRLCFQTTAQQPSAEAQDARTCHSCDQTYCALKKRHESQHNSWHEH